MQPPAVTRASLSFLSDLPVYQSVKPYEVFVQTGYDGPRTNCVFVDHHDIPIHDLRLEDRQDFRVDTAGFEFVENTSQHLPDPSSFHHSSRTSNVHLYLEETTTFLRTFFAADEVICYDWRYRRNQKEITPNYVYDRQDPGREAALSPASVVHSDESPWEGRRKIGEYLKPDEAEKWSQDGWRIRFINLWRPLVDFVEDAPLAMCDIRSLDKGDMMECDKVHSDHVGEGTYVKHRDRQRWYWLSRQTKREPVLFTNWDSDTESRLAFGVPHCSFQNPHALDQCSARESIEVRTMVITKRA